MLRDKIQPWVDWAKRAITQPRSQLTKWQQAARFAYDLARYGTRRLREDRASHMAAALAFRTLFALIPLVIVTSLIYGGMRGTEMLHELIGDVVEGAGLRDVQVVPDEVLGNDEEPISLGVWLENLIMRVADIDLQALGWVGVAVMIYAAIAMMVTVENCFNLIYRAPEGRSWLKRLPIYWTVLSISPLALGLIFYIDNYVAEHIFGVDAWEWTLLILRSLWGIAILWLLLLAIFMLMPNTKVAWRPAMIGALVAAVLFQMGRTALGAYVEGALAMRQIYGLIGLVPIFMLWVYIMWLVVLFGLEVSSTLQSLRTWRSKEMEQHKRPTRSGLVEPAAVLLVMERVAEAFEQSKAISAKEVAEATEIPEQSVALMLERLQAEGFVHRVDHDERRVTLACPSEQISGERLIEIGYELVDESGGDHKSELLEKLRESQRSLARGLTLASLVRKDASDQVSHL